MRECPITIHTTNNLINLSQKTTPKCHKKPHRNWRMMRKIQLENQVPLREPDLLIVLTGGQMAYRRDDGVYVIPLACLKD